MNDLVKLATGTTAHAAAATPGAEHRQVLTFLLGGEMYSIDILCIREIIWYAGLTEVPMMPACIHGVINLRGAVVPVMNLSNRLGRPSTTPGKSTCIVIVELDDGSTGARSCMGVVVDAVQAVLEIRADEIEPAPDFGARIRSDFIEGIGKVNGKFVILLNVHRVLSRSEIGALGQASAGAAREAVAA